MKWKIKSLYKLIINYTHTHIHAHPNLVFVPYLCSFTITYREFSLLSLCLDLSYQIHMNGALLQTLCFSTSVISSAWNASSSLLSTLYKVKGKKYWRGIPALAVWPGTSPWLSLGINFILWIGPRRQDQLITKKLPFSLDVKSTLSLPRLPFPGWLPLP